MPHALGANLKELLYFISCSINNRPAYCGVWASSAQRS